MVGLPGTIWGVGSLESPAVTTCWYCSSEVPETSQYCPSCGHSQTDRTSSPLFGVVDTTTGIWNSKFVSALVGQEANRAVRYHRPLSVLLIELDGPAAEIDGQERH